MLSRKEYPTANTPKEELYLNQVKLLDIFLSNGAITKAQYDKSFNDLTEKMEMSHLNSKKNK